MKSKGLNYILFIYALAILFVLTGTDFAAAKSELKYQYLPLPVQRASFPIKESFYILNQRKKLSKRQERKICRYLDIDPKKVFKDKRISAKEKRTEPLVYIALSQFAKSPVLMAEKWGLEENDPMYLFAVGLDNVKKNVVKMHEIKLETFQELIEKPLMMSIILSGHLKLPWSEYCQADMEKRQQILYSLELTDENDIDISSYAMYLVSVGYMIMSRQDNNVKYAKENFDLLTRIFDVIKELKSVYDPDNPLLYYIAKKIEMRF